MVCTPPSTQRGGKLLRGDGAALAQAALGVEDGRVVEDDVLFAAGAPFSSISATGCSISRAASSAGLAMVALAQMNCGRLP